MQQAEPNAISRFLNRVQASYLWRNGFFRRKLFIKRMAQVVRNPLELAPPVNAVVYSFVSEHDIPEQIVSLRSFLRNIGVPKEFVVVSDGSITPASQELLKANHPCVRCSDGQEFEASLGEEFLAPFRAVLEGNVFWRKFQIIAHISRLDDVGVYADSDVLFFPGAKTRQTNFCHDGVGKILYLPDMPTSDGKYLDSQLINDDDERKKPVNAGFAVFGKPCDWSPIIERLGRYEGEANFYTEQTMVHLMMQKNGAEPLDSRRHILSFDDMATWHDMVTKRPDAVLRHYVRPSRHRFWRLKSEFYS